MQTTTAVQERTKIIKDATIEMQYKRPSEYYLHIEGNYQHTTLRITKREAIRIIETLKLTANEPIETIYSTNKFYR